MCVFKGKAVLSNMYFVKCLWVNTDVQLFGPSFPTETFSGVAGGAVSRPPDLTTFSPHLSTHEFCHCRVTNGGITKHIRSGGAGSHSHEACSTLPRPIASRV